MAEKVVIRSNIPDRHGDLTPVKLLEEGLTTLNGPRKMRMLVNHRRDLPPIGYWDNAELVQEKSVFLLKAEPLNYTKREPVSWDETLITETFDSPVSFIEAPKKEEELTISLDKNSFSSIQVFNRLCEEIKITSDGYANIEADMRKHALSDPQIIITLAQYYFVLFPLLKPFLKKIGEKLAEDIAEDVYELSKAKGKGLLKLIYKVIKQTRRNAIPQNKPLGTIFEIPGDPYIELNAKTDDVNLVVKALSPSRLLKVHQRINDLSRSVKIKEAYFNLTEKGHWRFSHLLTEEGAIIGSKQSFERRDKLINRVKLNPLHGYSIAGNVKYNLDEEQDG